MVEYQKGDICPENEYGKAKDEKQAKRWPVTLRANGTAKYPFAYEPVAYKSKVLIPHWDRIQWIELAFQHLENGHSLRETAAWLGDKTGKTISYNGLNNLWRKQKGRKQTPRSKKLKEARKAREEKLTPEDKQERDINRKVGAERRRITNALKRLQNLDKKKGNTPSPVMEVEPVASSKGFVATSDTLIEEPQADIIFQPNPGPQTDFLAATEMEILYGGSAGGGKTYAMLADPLRYFGNPNFNGILFRRTNDELREIIWKAQELYPKAYPGAKWSEKKSQWVFPSGARIWFTYLERDEDVLRYQGMAFSWIGFDELTQYPTPFTFNYMRSRLRTTDPTLPLCLRCTTNPGGPGHGWVKKMFIDPAPPNTTFAATDLDTGQTLVFPEGHPKAGKPLFYRRFIPAKLFDNPYLSSDGVYEANLLSLPENQRRQLLEGDWNVADGAAFSEFREHIHTCDPFDIPPEWTRFRSCDFGYSSNSAVHWYAIDPSFDTLYVYRELYTSKLTAAELAAEILSYEAGEKIYYGVLDSSSWHKRGHTGPSIAEEMIRVGCRWRPADRTAGSRIAGKNRLHQLLRVDPVTEKPGIIFFNTCRQIIADLPVIPSDPKGSEDIDVRYASDHTYDSIRYGIMSRPRSYFDFDTGSTKIRNWQPADPVFGY